MKRITASIFCVLIFQIIFDVSANPQMLKKEAISLVMDSKGDPSDVQIEPPEEAEITYDIGPQMLISTRVLQKATAEDPLAHLRSVSDEAEEDRDSLHHPSFRGHEGDLVGKFDPVYSPVVDEAEEDRDHLHHN